MLLGSSVSKWCRRCTHTIFLAFQKNPLASLGNFCDDVSEKSEIQTTAVIPRHSSGAGLETQSCTYVLWWDPGRNAWFNCAQQLSEMTLHTFQLLYWNTIDHMYFKLMQQIELGKGFTNKITTILQKLNSIGIRGSLETKVFMLLKLVILNHIIK